VNSDYCKFHGGTKSRPEKTTKKRIDQLPPLYSAMLNQTLRNSIADQLDLPKADQLGFREELAIFRTTGNMVLTTYSAALDSLADPKSEKTPVEKIDGLQASSAMVQQFLKDVVALGKDVATVEAIGKDKISIHDIYYVINQIIKIIHDECGDKDEHGLAGRLVERLNTELDLPGDEKQEGATLDTDELILEALQTIPMDKELVAKGVSQNSRVTGE
jgi:hypothetical protein